LDEGKGIDVTVEVGSGRFIPALEEKLIGLKQTMKGTWTFHSPQTMVQEVGRKGISFT